jgi:transposase-like protein
MQDHDYQSFLMLFPTEEACEQHLVATRWEGMVVSPFDPSSKVYLCSNGRYRCQKSGKYFTLKTGTVFQGTKVPLQKWYYAIWLLSNATQTITSTEMGKRLGISQKSAWQMMRRIQRHFGGSLSQLQEKNIKKMDVVLDDDKLKLTEWLKLIKR